MNSSYGGAWGSMGSLVGGGNASPFADPNVITANQEGLRSRGDADADAATPKNGWFKQAVTDVSESFAPGTPGSTLLQSGAAQLSSWIQQQQSSLSALKAQLARKEARLRTAKQPGARARLTSEIEQLLSQIAALEAAIQQGGGALTQLPETKRMPVWAGFAAITGVLLALLGGAWFMLRKGKK